MLASKLTEKYQTTIPARVRKLLGLNKGDYVAFEIKDNKVILKKPTPFDLDYARSIESTLTEWASDADEEAYRDL